jgi:endonuclease-8
VPEGHTIHRVAADHNRHFAGQRLEARSPQGRFAAGARTLNGRVLKTVEAYGKHLLYRWEGKTLHIHLGLYGKFRLHKCPVPEPRGEVRLRVVGDARGFDLNGPTACELYSRQDETRLLERLGADPLRPDADCERLWDSALSQAKVRVESFAGKGGQVPKMQSTLRAVPVFGT